MAAVPKPYVVYQQEPVAKLWPEVDPLLARHYREIATYPDIPLRVDKDSYEMLDQAGMFKVYTARMLDVGLIGYAAFFVRPHLHYSESRQAVCDVVYVADDFRRGYIGIDLLAFAEEELKSEGCDVVYHHVKLAHPALGKLLGHMGYSPVETVYARRVG